MRAAKNVRFVTMGWSLTSLFDGGYSVAAGKKPLGVRWRKAAFESIRAAQRENPVGLLRQDRRVLWCFEDEFYWDDDGLASEDVKALLLQRKRRLQQKLNTAHSLMRAEAKGRPTRVAISSEIRRVVFERDGGRCVECDSNFDLQYDHVLPVALGGATTVENLQLLCADCNRRKSDSL